MAKLKVSEMREPGASAKLQAKEPLEIESSSVLVSNIGTGVIREERLASNASRVILTPSSTTFFGNAKLGPLLPLTAVPFVCLDVEDESTCRRVSVSLFISTNTLEIKAGKEVHSPLRRRESACS